jgi:hypothetical protein
VGVANALMQGRDGNGWLTLPMPVLLSDSLYWLLSHI